MKRNKLITLIVLILTLILSITAFACGGSSSTSNSSGANTGGTITGGNDSDESTSGGTSQTSYKEEFLNARDKIISDDVVGFEYDYELNLSVGIKDKANLTGKQVGTNKYSKSNSTSYLNKRTNSGALFNNGTIYEYYSNNDMSKLELNENNEIVDFETKKNATKTKYDSSSFAKALFTYKNSDIKAVEKNNNTYIIKSNAASSNVLSFLLDNLNHPIVEKLLKINMPETASATQFYVTYDSNKNIDKYVYEFEFSVSAISININYSLDFTKLNTAPTMNLPTFNDFYISDKEINSKLTIVNNSINAFKQTSSTENKFKLTTAIDYGITDNAINATLQGKSKRAYKDSISYFANLVEVDSDLKNADLYKENGLKDVKYLRGKISNKDVYDRKGSEDPIKVNNYTTRNNLDDYFLLLDNNFINSNNINSVSMSTKKDLNTIYSFTLSNTGIKALLNYINTVSILNPFISEEIKVLGDYNENDIKLSKIKFNVEIGTDGSLISINLEAKGKFDTKFTNSRDFKLSDRATFQLEYSFIPTSFDAKYEIPNSASNLDY